MQWHEAPRFGLRKVSVVTEIKVLASGCANCRDTIALIEQAARAKGVAVSVQKVEELRDIMAYGVMSTPGVVIDGKVVHAGGVPTPRQGRAVAGNT